MKFEIFQFIFMIKIQQYNDDNFIACITSIAEQMFLQNEYFACIKLLQIN